LAAQKPCQVDAAAEFFFEQRDARFEAFKHGPSNVGKQSS